MLTTTTSGGAATGPRSANSHLSPTSSSSRTPRLVGRRTIAKRADEQSEKDALAKPHQRGL